jgi:hypothetical protein
VNMPEESAVIRFLLPYVIEQPETGRLSTMDRICPVNAFWPKQPQEIINPRLKKIFRIKSLVIDATCRQFT